MASSTRKKARPEEPAELLSSPAGSLVFISHDSRDAELAAAFSKLLSSVSAGVLKKSKVLSRKKTRTSTKWLSISGSGWGQQVDRRGAFGT
jgi:hypothetical protein